MKNIRTTGALGLPVLLVLGLTACIGVRVDRDVADPGPAFARAEREIERLESEYPARYGRAHGLCLLAYDRDDRELVQVRVPMWIVDACMGLAEDAAREDRAGRLEGHYDIEWRALKDLGRFGPGLLASVADEESRILIWLK